jgi:hypothetical protein
MEKNGTNFFLGYHDIGTKFPPLLVMTNLCRRTVGHTRCVIPSHRIFSICMSQESNPDHMLKGTKTLTSYHLDQFIVGEWDQLYQLIIKENGKKKSSEQRSEAKEK